MKLATFAIFGLCAAVAEPGHPDRPVPPRQRGPEHIYTQTDVVGAPHGQEFYDIKYTAPVGGGWRRIKSITLAPCSPGEHVTYMKVEYSDFKSADKVTAEHGKRYENAKEASVVFETIDQRVSRVRLTTWKQKKGLKKHTRIGWIEVTSSKGTITCGAKNADDHVFDWPAPQDSSLLHFMGTAGDAIDSLQAEFIDKSKY